MSGVQLQRHSPDDSRASVNSSDFLASLEARRERRTIWPPLHAPLDTPLDTPPETASPRLFEGCPNEIASARNEFACGCLASFPARPLCRCAYATSTNAPRM